MTIDVDALQMLDSDEVALSDCSWTCFFTCIFTCGVATNAED